ncbi:MAG: DNA polymerase III subunit chi [Burkholderiales bacterium]|nr:DNA polymerase III subunit chi [Burkholderiales bacterium]
MTEVAFHFNAPDRLGYACRLVRKAVGAGAKVVVTGEQHWLSQLDVALWTFAPLEFLPHSHDASPAVTTASPVVLAQSPRISPHQQVLVNLGGPVPEGFERFERLIEVVTQDEDDRQGARRRWKHYADRGYSITRHDLGTREAG